jgi:hypothetical protein
LPDFDLVLGRSFDRGLCRGFGSHLVEVGQAVTQRGQVWLTSACCLHVRC